MMKDKLPLLGFAEEGRFSTGGHYVYWCKPKPGWFVFVWGDVLLTSDDLVIEVHKQGGAVEIVFYGDPLYSEYIADPSPIVIAAKVHELIARYIGGNDG